MFSLLAKERIIAGPGFNRWLVPPAALGIHLSIGMAYGFSVFWLPLSKAIGVTEAINCPEDMALLERVTERLFGTSCDWPVSWLQGMYTLFFIFLGGSAAAFGKWVERAGPRKAGVVAAVCWGGGLMISAVGVYRHQLWMLWLGSGVIGGIGLGLGYISPVATLVQWFPDRRGLATGMAIMGFGGGAMIGSPLADRLMRSFASPTDVGVWQTFLVLGVIYFAAMMLGAFGYRVPAPGWRPGSLPDRPNEAPARQRYVPVEVAQRSPQFWLMWCVLCLNVSAGIGVIGMASPMLQEVFGGRLIGVETPLRGLSVDQRALVATVAAAFTGLLSLCNIIGRIGWASLSDRIGRKTTYTVFFVLGATLYISVPATKGAGGLATFVAIFCVILSMYGGGFATVPAYLADYFGPKQISAIHGRLLTAWSVAGILGPLAITTLREEQLARKVPAAEVYDVTMYVLSGLLVVGLFCNLLIRPVSPHHFVEEVPTSRPDHLSDSPAGRSDSTTPTWLIVLAWSAVGAPLLWSVWATLDKARTLFG